MVPQRAAHTSQWYPIGGDLRARDLLLEVPLDWSDSARNPASSSVILNGDGAAGGGVAAGRNSATGGEPTTTGNFAISRNPSAGAGVAASSHQADGPRTIVVYAREVVSAQNFNRRDELPLLVYLQGGPGGKSPRPLDSSGWLGHAVDKFRVILPDQRGTGRSTPLCQRDFADLPARIGAEILACFRADSIIKDLEALREAFFPGKQWWTLGQSYGGFLTLHYLSTHPDSLVGSVVTGGLPSLDPDPAEVYRRTFPRVRQKNKLFYERFPHLIERISRVADIIESTRPVLPSGDVLTVRRLQLLGLDFGMAVGFDRVHWIFDEAFTDVLSDVIGRESTGVAQSRLTGLLQSGQLTDTFLHQVEAMTNFGTNPLFAVLQEAIYGEESSQWAAQQERLRHPEFDPGARPLFFTGETMFPWMFEEISTLRGFGPAVNALAEATWPIDLYDPIRLAQNPVPVEAAVYFNDMYVDAGLSLDTAQRVNNLETLVTNEFEHDGLRVADIGERLFERLANRLGGFVQSR